MQSIEDQIAQIDALDEATGTAVFVTPGVGQRALKGATKERLVERLAVMGASYDTTVVHTLLITFRSFNEQLDLFHSLASRFVQAARPSQRARCVTRARTASRRGGRARCGGWR